MGILEQRLQATGGHVAGRWLLAADIPVGLSVNRWFETLGAAGGGGLLRPAGIARLPAAWPQWLA